MSALPPKHEPFQRLVAKTVSAAEMAIVQGRICGNHFGATRCVPHPLRVCDKGQASPASRSGISTAGPKSYPKCDRGNGQDLAQMPGKLAQVRNSPFSCSAESVCSASIITLNRGSNPCSRNRLSRPSFRPAPCRAVFPLMETLQPIRRQSAPLAARLPARSSQMPRAAAKPRAPLSAPLPVACPAAFRACQPAIDLTYTAAPKRGADLTPRPFRAAARGGLFACQSAPARAD